MRARWKQLDPLQQGLLIGLVAGVPLAVLAGDLIWLAATLGSGAATGHVVARRRARKHAARRGAPVSRQQRRQDEFDQQESSLRAASSHHGRELLYRSVDRSTVLERVRANAPGFAEERYEEALSAAVARLEFLHRHAMERRARDIAEARQDDVLNAVFALHYRNRRFHRQQLDDGIAPEDLHQVLGDLWPAEEIEAAVTRSDALIEDGMRYEWQPDQGTQHRDELAAGHPGFSRTHLQAALAWGYQKNR